MRGANLAFALLACASCSPAAAPQPAPAQASAPAPDLGLRAHTGEYYSDFIRRPGMARYAPEHLGLTPAQLARFQRAMSVETPASLASGGGSSVLAFQGCMAHDCPDAVAVLAIDVADGEILVGVRDQDGEAVFIPDDKLQALLEATSPSRRWFDPVAWEAPKPSDPAPGAP